MDTVTITVGADISVATPFDPDFPAKARKIGGPWSGPDKTWRFDVRDEDRVRALVREIYGTDGSDNAELTVTVRLVVDYPANGNQEFRAAGRRLAYRPERDKAVHLSTGVIIVEGQFPDGGGSVKNPRLDPLNGKEATPENSGVAFRRAVL